VSVTDIDTKKKAEGEETELARQVREEQEDYERKEDAAGGEEPTAEETKPTPPMQVPLPGDWDAISGEFGGRDPETSEIRLLGGKMPIEGSFAKGAEFDVLVRVKVTGVLGQDVVDEWGTVERTVRRHMTRMISVQRVNR